MNRNLRTERLFSLGDFKNIKFCDEITEIPQELILNKEAMSHLYFYQLLQIEQAFIKYMKLSDELIRLGQYEKMLEYIEELREQNFKDILESLKNGKGE